MEDKLVYCTNCKRHIAAINYVIHNAHCVRNIQLCERCEEPVPRSELEKHLEENHAIHACSDCDAPMEKWLIEKHKSSCSKRLTPCEFCKLEVPLDELQEHTTACGSRTEKCIICKKHVMIKDLKEHPNFCQKEEGEINCDDCGLKVAVKFFANHASVCKGRELYAKEEETYCVNCGLMIAVKLFADHVSVCKGHELYAKGSEENIITCEFCDVKVPFQFYQEHVFICGTFEVKCPVCNEDIMIQDQKRHLEICRKATFIKQIPCNYCNKSIPEDGFVDHVSNCGSRTEKCEKCNKYVVLKEKEMHPFVCKMVSRAHGNCRYCHEVISWLDMNVHEAACAIERGNDDYSHQNRLNEMSLEKSSLFEKYTSNDGRTNQVCGKRCPFCCVSFPQSFLAKHLECCEERPYNCSECLKPMPYKEKEKHTKFCHGNKEKKKHFGAVALYEENKSFHKDRGIQKLKQCEFCDERLPDLIFENHLGTCSKRHEKCKLCNTSVLVKEMKNHLMFSCSFDKNYDNRYLDCDKHLYAENMPTSTRNFEQLKYLEENVEVCPSCQCKIPVVRFPCHVQYCLEGIKFCKFCGSRIQKKDERTHLQNCKKLFDASKDFASQSDKKDGVKNKNRNEGESFFGAVGKWIQNKGKKEESMEEIRSKYAPQGRQNRRKMQESVLPNQLPQHEIPLVPCEFCEELYPFENLIEHQSGCRPDLTSYPKKDEDGIVGGNMQEHNKIGGPYKSIASGNSKKMNTEWTEVASRKSRKTSTKGVLVEQERVESSSSRNNELSKESGFSGSAMQYKQHLNRDKYFYYQPPGYTEIERNCLNVKHSSDLNEFEETSKIACAEESDPERLHKGFPNKDSFLLYKFNSTNTKENCDSSNEAHGSPTCDEHDQHQVKNNNSYYYQVFPALPNDEKSILSKVVGAERIVKRGVINKTKNVALGFIYENSKASIDRQVVSDNHTTERNLAMKTVWNTECDIHKKIAENSNAKEVECNLSNMEIVSNIFEDEKHANDKTVTNEQQDNDVNKDSEMNAYFKYLSSDNDGYYKSLSSFNDGYYKSLSSNNDGCIDMKERVEEKEKLTSDSTANCDCGNQICYCAIAKPQSSLAENSLSRENSHPKSTLSDDNEPKPMEVDSPIEVNALNQVVQKKDSSEINCIEVEK
ncbi:TRAF-type zinc finger domain-containing protein 1 [Trichonephila inaurata madagascariensis]|uniref:TRAF-type zinc finger domain-containing protein 1 n=1 Tax=Trichonephila inaurata madagascariensis TaxID=2747483 RepID=A0A8X6XK33_9ARAC|nr:TRAF-type zinc finger domain-containing protein 1 [Trichonephila inaurata madagascariensis]